MSEAVIQRLKISREGVILIKSFEGFRPRAIRRDDGQWVIGYGHTLSAREGASVSEADAELLLQYDLIPVARAVNEGVAAAAPLNQHQFDALASFAFSVGVDRFQSSDVLSRLNAGFVGEAADAMIGWPEPAVAETALRRRAAERALFVARPGAPVALADLLAAPLPPPQVVAPAPVEPPAPEAVIEAVIETAPETTPAPVAFADRQAEPEVPSEYVAPDLDGTRSARHAAVASLLADPVPVLHQPEPPEAEAEADLAPVEAPALETPAPRPETPGPETPVEPAEAEGAASEALEVASEEPTPAPTTAPTPPPAVAGFAANLPMQRYSAYAGTIVGPLPGSIRPSFANAFQTSAAQPTPAAAQPAAEADVNPFAPPGTGTAQAETAQSETVEAETVETETVPAEAIPTDAVIEVPMETPAEPAADASPAEPTPAPTPWYVGEGPRVETAPAAPFAHNPFAASPFPEPPAPADVTPTEATPVEASPVQAAAIAPEANPFALVAPPAPAQPSPFDAAPRQPTLEIPVFGSAPAAEPVPTPDPWPAPISATSEPRTDGALLVLNGSPETEVFASPRLVWPHGEQSGDDAPALFEDDGSLRLAPGNILRHEIVEDTPPAQIPWGELAAYGVMGGFGLVSFGMSMAAFRRAADDSNGGDGTILIAIVLAVVGAACVGVSAYNLYRRWGRVDEE